MLFFNKKMKILLCAIGRKENKYVRDWVEYHKNIGITKILILDNNHDGEEHFEDVIGDYIDSGFVIINNCRNKSAYQLQGYSECYKNYGNEYDWLIFIDFDEYITLQKHSTIVEYLSQAKFDNFNIIKLNWLNYGDNDLVYYENKPVYERFTKPCDLGLKIYYDVPQNFHTKSIIRGGLGELIWSTPHTPDNIEKCCANNGEETIQGPLSVMNYEEAFLKHYATKTATEYLDKIKIGTADRKNCFSYKQQLKYAFFKYNKWTKEKEDILNMGLDKELKTLVCCIGKNENRYVREYVEWYKKIGLTHIRLYDNNDIDGERFEDSIGDYINSGFVELVDYRGKVECQLQAYEECYKELGGEYDWILFIDCGDEYLHLVNHKTITDFLSDDMFKDYDMLHLNLMTFGDCGHLTYEDKPLIERFPRPIPFDTKVAYDFPENAHISSIVRGGLKEVLFRSTPHTPYPNNLRCCNDVGEEVNSNSPFSNISFRNAFFRHYTTKTAEEYCNKMRRGFPDQIWDNSRIANLVETRFFRTNEVTKEKVELFKRELGVDMSHLIIEPFDGKKDKNVKIYSLCYEKKNFPFLDNEVITPLQVGAANGTNVCGLKDNVGDNISSGNYFYIENTGTYWIWKNVKDAKYKGQMQYRRPLSGVTPEMNFEEVFTNYDVITCEPFHHPSHKTPTKEEPMIISADTVEQGYAFSNCLDDLLILEMAVKMYYPDYADDYDKYIKKGPNLYYSNGFIMKAEDYDRYCEFLFNCLNGYLMLADIKSEKDLVEHVKYNLEVGKYQRYPDYRRVPTEAIKWQCSIGGFLSERLWTLWLQHNFSDDKVLKLPYIKMEEKMYT